MQDDHTHLLAGTVELELMVATFMTVSPVQFFNFQIPRLENFNRGRSTFLVDRTHYCEIQTPTWHQIVTPCWTQWPFTGASTNRET